MWTRKGLIFDKRHSQLPVVDEYEAFYRIYYSTRDGGKSVPMFIDVEKNNPASIINESATPILQLGERGSFDWAGVMPTDIVTVDGVKYLYYIGWSIRKDVPYHNSVGLAISTDNGGSWEKFSKGPVFSTSYKEPGYIGTVDILIENGVWRMWYLSCLNWIEHDGVMEPLYDIKYAESINGIDWEPKQITCIPLTGDEGGISSARVLKIRDNQYKMWYSIRNKTDYRFNRRNAYRIKEATSTDGIFWNIENNFISLDTSPETWEDIMMCYPEVLKRDTGLIMFYNGNGFGKTGIGYAIK